MLTFDDPNPIEEPVSIGGRPYTLREATADVSAKYRSFMMRGFKVDDLGGDKKVSMDASGIPDAEPFLVSLCLFNGDGKHVDEQVVRGWSSRVTKALHTRIMEISPALKEDQAAKDGAAKK